MWQRSYGNRQPTAIGLLMSRQRSLLRPLPVIVLLAALGLLFALGFWQLQRGAQKQALLELVTLRSTQPALQVGRAVLGSGLEYFPAVVRGEYETTGQFLLDNKSHAGRPGFYVLTPFRISGSDTRLLVNRGWIPLQGSRSQLPQPQVPAGSRQLAGQLYAPQQAFTLERKPPPPGAALRQNLDLAVLNAQAPHPLQPYVLRLSAKEPGGFVRQWPLPGGQAVNRHRGYALQWFAMALVLVGVFLAMVRRERKSDPEQEPPHD